MNIGPRIRYFRNRSKLTQLELELALDSPSGFISRIESGKTNPTKETVKKIANILKLHYKELDYLIGLTAQPASRAEIELVRKDVQDYLERPGIIAYVLDDRWFIIEGSKTFAKLLGISQTQKEKILMKTIPQVILDERFGIKSLLSQDEYEELVKTQLTQFYHENHFMLNEEIFQDTVNLINSNPKLKLLFDKTIKETPYEFTSLEHRKVTFKIGPIKIPMIYAREPLINHPRFELIEYKPTNKVVKQLSKILSLSPSMIM